MYNLSIKPLTILKLGGSVITRKDTGVFEVREKLVCDIARELKNALIKKPQRLILVHGVGSFGHVLAKRYGLHEGVINTRQRWEGFLKTTLSCQRLNTIITDLFLEHGLPAISFRTNSIAQNNDGSLKKIDISGITTALEEGMIPLLYGDMVFDTVRGGSICSGDAIVAYLATALTVEQIFFATDVDGIYTADPHVDPHAQLMQELCMEQLQKDEVRLTGSHNEDVTGGLAGKIGQLLSVNSASLREAVVFNGFKKENYTFALVGEPFQCTKIKRSIS